MPSDRKFMDTQQTARFLDVHEKQIYTLIHERGLPATKVTGKWLFPRHLVERWIEANVINMPRHEPLLKASPEMLLLAGSDDPLLVRLIALFRERYPESLVLQSRAGSSDGLAALKKGLVHIACVHLVDPRGGYDAGHLREILGEDIAVVVFAARTQGVLLPPGNPEGVENAAGAFAKSLRWAVRDVGTGTRALMELEMDRQGVDSQQVLDGGVRVLSHLDTALAVRAGQADAGFGIEAAARQAGCHFAPLRQERFDLIVRKENFFLPQVQALTDMLGEEAFTRMADELGGYDLSETGKMAL